MEPLTEQEKMKQLQQKIQKSETDLIEGKIHDGDNLLQAVIKTDSTLIFFDWRK